MFPRNFRLIYYVECSTGLCCHYYSSWIANVYGKINNSLDNNSPVYSERSYMVYCKRNTSNRLKPTTETQIQLPSKYKTLMCMNVDYRIVHVSRYNQTKTPTVSVVMHLCFRIKWITLLYLSKIIKTTILAESICTPYSHPVLCS